MLVTGAQRVNQLLDTLEHVDLFLGLDPRRALLALNVEIHVKILVFLLQVSLLLTVVAQNLPQVFYLVDLVQHCAEFRLNITGRLLLCSISEVPDEIVRTVEPLPSFTLGFPVVRSTTVLDFLQRCLVFILATTFAGDGTTWLLGFGALLLSTTESLENAHGLVLILDKDVFDAPLAEPGFA